MGVRIRRPSTFQGITKKEAKKGIIPEGDFKTKEDEIKKRRLTFAIKKPKEATNAKGEDGRSPM
eukprot:6476340-Heterocapsa_arctica.AAC.1